MASSSCSSPCGPGSGSKRRVPGQPGALARLLEDSDQPVVGAEYLQEYSGGPDAKFEPLYYCTLCSAHALYEIMYQHVIGVKHRTKYMVRDFSTVKWFKSFKAWTMAINMNK